MKGKITPDAINQLSSSVNTQLQSGGKRYGSKKMPTAESSSTSRHSPSQPSQTALSQGFGSSEAREVIMHHEKLKWIQDPSQRLKKSLGVTICSADAWANDGAGEARSISRLYLCCTINRLMLEEDVHIQPFTTVSPMDYWECRVLGANRQGEPMPIAPCNCGKDKTV